MRVSKCKQIEGATTNLVPLLFLSLGSSGAAGGRLGYLGWSCSLRGRRSLSWINRFGNAGKDVERFVGSSASGGSLGLERSGLGLIEGDPTRWPRGLALEFRFIFSLVGLGNTDLMRNMAGRTAPGHVFLLLIELLS